MALGQRCREAGVRPSTGSRGDGYDNAMCPPATDGAGSFFATLECELIARRRFATKAEARMAVFHFGDVSSPIEEWYNPRRRHSGLCFADGVRATVPRR